MKFSVALAQISPFLGNLDKNMEKCEQIIEQAIRDRVDLIVFPELTLTGYFSGKLPPAFRLCTNRRSIHPPHRPGG